MFFQKCLADGNLKQIGSCTHEVAAYQDWMNSAEVYFLIPQERFHVVYQTGRQGRYGAPVLLVVKTSLPACIGKAISQVSIRRETIGFTVPLRENDQVTGEEHVGLTKSLIIFWKSNIWHAPSW